MRKLRLMIVIGLASVAWKRLLQPRIPAIKAQVAKTREQIEPALRKATGNARSVSQNAVESVRDLSLTAAETAESVRDVSLSAAETADSVATAMAEHEAEDAAAAPTNSDSTTTTPR